MPLRITQRPLCDCQGFKQALRGSRLAMGRVISLSVVLLGGGHKDGYESCHRFGVVSCHYGALAGRMCVQSLGWGVGSVQVTLRQPYLHVIK